MPPLTRYAAFVERPPFSESRRPPPRAGETVAERPPFELSGVVMTARTRNALFSRTGSPDITRRREGQVIHDWVVDRILADRVVLRSGPRQFEMKIGPAPTLGGRPLAGLVGGQMGGQTGVQTLATQTSAPAALPVPVRNTIAPKDTRWLSR